MDAAIRDWMREHGWKVNSTRYYFDEEVYAWRHEEEAGSSPTLWIARTVLENQAPFALVSELERLAIGDRIRFAPKARFLIVEEDGQIHVRPWRHGPDRGA
jgi:hypothetical protein